MYSAVCTLFVIHCTLRILCGEGGPIRVPRCCAHLILQRRIVVMFPHYLAGDFRRLRELTSVSSGERPAGTILGAPAGAPAHGARPNELNFESWIAYLH